MLVYCAKNITNGKVYIGQTLQSLKKRISDHTGAASRGSRYPFHRAIQKYGAIAFEWRIIEECMSVDQLNEQEIYWILKLNAIVPNGYNVRTGGRGSVQTHTFKEKIRASLVHKRKSVVQFDPLTGQRVTEYVSLNDAARATGISLGNMAKCVKSPTNHTAGGFGFVYKEQYDSKEPSSFIIAGWSPRGKRSKVVIGSNGNEEVRYSSSQVAADAMGCARGSIMTSIRNGTICRGYRWRYDQ